MMHLGIWNLSGCDCNSRFRRLDIGSMEVSSINAAIETVARQPLGGLFGFSKMTLHVSPLDQLELIEGGAELLDHIEPLWIKLNALHAEKSTYFRETFSNTSFSQRKQAFEGRSLAGKLLVILAKTQDQEAVGYCVCSVNDSHSVTRPGKTGEIDSMFVLAAYRRRGLGRMFLKQAMDWFDENGADDVIAFVGVGNEEVLDFYKSFGLLPRAIRLERKR
jgi:diamine N-acetyltransferase